MTLQPSIAFDTIDIVGREREKQLIRDALSLGSGTRALILRGPGGIGKTRLLRWAVEEARQQGILTSGIVDLYHSATHSNSGIECAILLGSSHPRCAREKRHADSSVQAHGGVDPLQEGFQNYWKLREDYERKRDQGSEMARLEELRANIANAFVDEYDKLANARRILLVFDTAELIQYESDVIQRISQPSEVALEVKAWITQILPKLANTVILLAGRGPRPERFDDPLDDPRVRLWSAIEQGLASLHPQILDLDVFALEETNQYFTAVAETARFQADRDRARMSAVERRALFDAAARIEQVTADVRQQLHEVTEGFPVRLGLAIDLLLFGDLFEYLAEIETGQAEPKWEDVRRQVVARLESTSVDVSPSEILRYLACARSGMTPELLQHLMSTPGSASKPALDDCRRRLDAIARLSFVKKYGDSEEVFLHDEMYDLLEECLIRERRAELGYYSRIGEFYEAGRDPVELPDDSQVSVLHYRLRHNPRIGFETYVELDERAIKGHYSGLDLRLRDETLRFLDDRYYEELSEQYGWPRSKVDLDCAVRWVKRHVARHDNQRAVDVAETVLSLGPEPYRSLPAEVERCRQAIPSNILAEAEGLFRTDDPFFWGHLLTYYGEALLYLNKPEKQIDEVLNRVIALLGRDVEEVEAGFKGWLRARILGRIHNNLGYFNRIHGRYGQALVEYKRALPYFERANIPDEQADTLNNLAFLLGLLGRTDSALTQIDRSLRLRRRINQLYPLALSYNTRGYINTWDDHPESGRKDCEVARSICAELNEPRGGGLAFIGLGFALRKLGDQWKDERYDFDEAEQYFGESETWLTQAELVFDKQVKEPIRLWEARNELGSLYCDWAFLALKRGDTKREHECYSRSEDLQRRALALAREHGLAFQEADSRDDLAQVLADEGRFEEAEQELAFIESMLVPEVYKLKEGVGFDQELEAGETALLSMGKICLQRGIWAFRAIENNQIPPNERAEKLRQGVRQFALSTAYLDRFWPASDSLRKTLRSFSKRLAQAQVPADLARQAVREIEDIYRADLRALKEVIDDTLGT